MTQETAQTLYKVLDANRTQGKWIADDGDVFSLKTGGHIAQIYDGLDRHISNQEKETVKANEAYTALAVNNLAKVADALQDMISAYERERGLLNIEYLHQSYHKAKEALKAIS